MEVLNIGNMGNFAKLNMSRRMSVHGGFDWGIMRPWSEVVNGHEKFFVAINQGIEGHEKVLQVDNAALRKDEWIALDEAVRQAAVLRTPAVQDLINRGLTFGVNGMNFTVLESENISEITAASISMTGYSQSEKDTVDHGLVGLPLPFTFKDWDISARGLGVSQNRGQPLDVSNGEAMARVIAEGIESAYFLGLPSLVFGGYQVYGLTTFPQRNTGTMTATWATATGEQILDDVIDMMQDSRDARHFGPWVLYIPTVYEKALQQDFKADSDKSVRMRLMELNGLEEIIVADFLTADNICLVQVTSDNVRVIDGMAPTSIQWEREGGLKLEMKTMAIRPVQLRADYAGNSGITHYTL